MAYNTRTAAEEPNILTCIHKGMAVYDKEGEPIGEVDWVYPGTQLEDEYQRRKQLPPIANRDRAPYNSSYAMLTDVIAPDDVPVELAETLMTSGFIHIAPDEVEALDRYVTPDQIAFITEEGVILNQ